MDQTPEQQAPPPVPPPQPSLQIGDKSIPADQVAACVDPKCKKCRGAGFVRGKKNRRVVCLCIHRELARRYGDEEDRRRLGVATAEEVALRQLDKREGWKVQKEHHLGTRIAALEAQERELTQKADAAIGEVAARRDLLAVQLQAGREQIAGLEQHEKALMGQVEDLRQRARLLEAQHAESFAKRIEMSQTLAKNEHALNLLDAGKDVITAAHAPELARIRKDLDKTRRRLATHLAYNGEAKAADS